jgi:hypothetical protein
LLRHRRLWPSKGRANFGLVRRRVEEQSVRLLVVRRCAKYHNCRRKIHQVFELSFSLTVAAPFLKRRSPVARVRKLCLPSSTRKLYRSLRKTRAHAQASNGVLSHPSVIVSLSVELPLGTVNGTKGPLRGAPSACTRNFANGNATGKRTIRIASACDGNGYKTLASTGPSPPRSLSL